MRPRRATAEAGRSADGDLIAKVRRRARNLMRGGRGSHGFDHVKRVLYLSRRLGREAGADLEVLTLAALLHDIGRPEEAVSGGSACHAEIGSAMAARILEGFGARPSLVRKVAECVRQHRYRGGSPPRSLEASILYDADKLDSLGAVGIGRAFLFAGEVGARLHNSRSEALSGGSYSPEDTAYREYLVKLRKIPSRMKTAAGRRLAGERVEYMDRFFRRLADETRGKV